MHIRIQTFAERQIEFRSETKRAIPQVFNQGWDVGYARLVDDVLKAANCIRRHNPLMQIRIDLGIILGPVNGPVNFTTSSE